MRAAYVSVTCFSGALPPHLLVPRPHLLVLGKGGLEL